MPRPNKSDTLPNEIEIRWFICRCFDLQRKDLGLSGPQLQRAIHNQDISEEELNRVRQALQKGIDTVRRPLGLGSFTDDMISTCLRLYEKVRPQLKTGGLSRSEALILLVEHLFVPTACAVMFRHWRFALGTELQGDQSWYLPVWVEGQLQMPVPRVLDRWLRTAGFKTAYGVSKTIVGKSKSTEVLAKQWEAWKRSVKNCLNGEHLPPLTKLHGLVDAFPEQVAWLDDAESWKGRFTLAFAIQRACEKLDESCPGSSGRLAALVQGVENDRVVADADNVLSDSFRFFATRLIQRRLKQTKQWEKIAAKVPPSIRRCFGPEVSDDEIEQVKRQDAWQMNIGNHLLAFIKSQPSFKRRQRAWRTQMDHYAGLDQFIVELGVQELNQLLDEKRRVSKPKRR